MCSSGVSLYGVLAWCSSIVFNMVSLDGVIYMVFWFGVLVPCVNLLFCVVFYYGVIFLWCFKMMFKL